VILCSCNVLSDVQIRSAIASTAPRSRMSHVYASLGCAAKCGRCAHTINIMLKETRRDLVEITNIH
jgi:bacterioferritin-associated ferredoxin